jgi:hypothetical protein
MVPNVIDYRYILNYFFAEFISKKSLKLAKTTTTTTTSTTTTTTVNNSSSNNNNNKVKSKPLELYEK